jgi:tetrahydromethanopterin S-methyltransferase subunit H
MTMTSSASAARGLVAFQTEQQTFDIGGVRIGGKPGVRPAVLIGTIFYHGQKILIDEDRGEFQQDAAERLIREQEDYAERTGNPCMFDVVGATPEAMRKNLEYMARTTKAPLLIDGTTTEVRLAGLEYAAHAGIQERVVYNSIQPEVSDEELAAIQKAGVEAALILTYYMQDFTGAGRVQCVKELLPRAQQAGIRKLIIDTCVLDLASFGQAMSAMHDIKDELGLPVGGGVHNALAMWRGLKTKMGPHAKSPCMAAAIAATVAVGADFALYGPVEDAKYVFPAAAMVDTAFSQLAMERGDSPGDGHPRYRIG